MEHALDSLARWLDLVKIDDFVRAGLHEELTRVIDRIHEIGGLIHQTYFDFQLGDDWTPADALPAGDVPAVAVDAAPAAQQRSVES